MNLDLYEEVKRALEENSLEEILEFNDLTPEEVLVFLYENYGLRFSRYV